ncbi:uncharacterized protein E0L32_008080 [Thyridium curvatum]|uniref:Uncharacterized protein n=1 Tax=Thyridium curvatum TaxID=1093900 RepID=A0A507ATH4_9PEZI|nr:uncharacterized protein E0L32_008080 [Thyridium curvatum]TPX11043.1 hypothetical protein E0L32_008080 [Thyridium curvatum]
MSSDSASPPWDYIAKLVCIGDSGCGKSSLTIRLCEGRFVAHHDVTIGVEFGSRIVPVGPPHSSSLAPSATTTTTTLFPDQQLQQQQSLSSKDDSQTPPAATSSSSSPSSSSPTSHGQQQPEGGLPAPRRNPPTKAAQQHGPSQPQKHMKLSLWDTAGQETYKSVTRSYFRGASGALLVFDLTRRQTFQHAIDWLNDLRQIAEPDIVVVLVGNKADLTMQQQQQASEEAGGNGAQKNQREVTRQEAEDWARRNGVLEYVETSAKSGDNVEMAFMRVAERIYQNIQAGKYDLNDRRSGVKGPSAGGSRQVKLSADASKRGSYGGCC